eukprot:4343882-Amphidinium_carterae.1
MPSRQRTVYTDSPQFLRGHVDSTLTTAASASAPTSKTPEKRRADCFFGRKPAMRCGKNACNCADDFVAIYSVADELVGVEWEGRSFGGLRAVTSTMFGTFGACLPCYDVWHRRCLFAIGAQGVEAL